MANLTKKRKAAEAKFDGTKLYDLAQATQIVKQVSTTKFDATVDIAVRLGVDPKKSTEMVRGTVSLPHGTGRTVNVLVLADPAKCEEALAAGADMAGLDEYVEKIKGGWTNVDVIICTPAVMAKVGALGRVLGPRGLMPNPKTGTVTMDVAKAVKEVKAGKIDFKVDKAGIIHAVIGKASFDAVKLSENANELLQTLVKLKPSTAKGAYIKSITVSSTMSPAVKVDTRVVARNLQFQRTMATRAQKDQAIAELVGEIKATNVLYLADASSMDARGDQQPAPRLQQAGRRRSHEGGEEHPAAEGDGAHRGQGLQRPVPHVGRTDRDDVRREGQRTGQDDPGLPQEGHQAPSLKSAWIDEAVFIGDDQVADARQAQRQGGAHRRYHRLLQSPIKNVIGSLQGGGGQKIAGLVKALEARASA
jgi:large subunit ribosomal protein L1